MLQGLNLFNKSEISLGYINHISNIIHYKGIYNMQAYKYIS